MIKERNETIIRMRVEEKKTLDQIANQFGVSPRENKTNHSKA
jgi:DNA-directed RNA polymerase sigma subunit (sigma70/sigma32)